MVFVSDKLKKGLEYEIRIKLVSYSININGVYRCLGIVISSRNRVMEKIDEVFVGKSLEFGGKNRY